MPRMAWMIKVRKEKQVLFLSIRLDIDAKDTFSVHSDS
jgi:hypothetical protein